ncbi:MAG: ATP-binding protein, partial [Myxococcota bacterium]
REHFDELPDAVQPAFLRICDSVQRLQRMVEASGQYLRGEALSFRPVNVQDVGALLAELADEFEVKTVNRLNRSEARLDAYWLRVCVRNLLENAVRHGVRPVEMQLDNDDDRLLVSVQDAGRGLDRSLNHAVQPFVSCAASQGLGFGLAVVHRMVGAMGGRLSYRSNPTRFRVELPGVLR